MFTAGLLAGCLAVDASMSGRYNNAGVVVNTPVVVEGCVQCCKPSFRTPQARASHFSAYHGCKPPKASARLLACPYCPSSFSTGAGLAGHLVHLHGRDVGAGGVGAGAGAQAGNGDEGESDAGDEGGVGNDGPEPPFSSNDSDDEEGSSSSSFQSSSRDSDLSSTSSSSAAQSGSESDGSDSDSPSSSSTSELRDPPFPPLHSEEEANSSEECLYEVDQTVFPDIRKAETRWRDGS